MQIKKPKEKEKMTERTISKIMHGFQISLATIMLLCMTISFGYHLFAGNLNLFTFLCFLAMWTISYKMFGWSIAEYREEMKQD